MDTKIKFTTLTGINIKFLVKNPNEHQQNCWANKRFYESHSGGLLSYMLKKVYQGGTILDIGASIGNHSVYFDKVLNYKVTSVEPVKSSYDHLIKNLKLNKISAKTHNVALGNHEGRVSMENVSKKSFNVGMYQVREGSDVKITKIDNLFRGKQFDVIKIDVEHYNIELLTGGQNFFKNQENCHVFIECEDKEILGRTNRLMKGYGFKFTQDLVLNHTPTYLWTK